MGTYTTNYNLFMPTIGEQGWGELVNGNFTTIDTTMGVLNTRLMTCESTDVAYNTRLETLEAGEFETINCTGTITADEFVGGVGNFTKISVPTTTTDTGFLVGTASQTYEIPSKTIMFPLETITLVPEFVIDLGTTSKTNYLNPIAPNNISASGRFTITGSDGVSTCVLYLVFNGESTRIASAIVPGESFDITVKNGDTVALLAAKEVSTETGNVGFRLNVSSNLYLG